jgi:predicted transcriptional regulator
LADEAAALIAVVDPTRANVSEAVTAWRSGSTAAIPFGLHGIGVRESAEPQTDSPTAYVIAEPGKKGCRFLLPGLALTSPARILSRDSARSGARTETGVAALALAGETGDSRDGFFRSVYGFSFVPYRHRAVLDTLCHRMRTLLGTAGEIRRNEADASSRPEAPNESGVASQAIPTISLAVRETIIVPDMRCILPTADRVLRALALLGPSSANAAAECLRMPLRSVQAVLQQLVAEGACTTERDGRRVAYRIEDTTFTEVTSP